MQPKIVEIIVSATKGEDRDCKSVVAELIKKAGVASDVAERAFNLVQIAWGRSFLDGLGITFSELYYCFDANGSCIESGQLKDNSYFKWADLVANDYKNSSAFELLALTSAEVNAVNRALNNGSTPHDLITAPACIFLAPATDKEIETAQNFVTEQLQRENPQQSKAWWRF